MRVSLKNDESGMVAFVVTSFLIIMISIVVFAFSQSTRREQRQALDRQLSTQAYYTAESATNEAIKYIKGEMAKTPVPAEFSEQKTDCTPLAGTYTGKLEGQDSDDVFKYTCVMWDTTPQKLVFQELNDQGKVISLQTKTGNLSKLKISWEKVDEDNARGTIRTTIMPFTGNRDNLIGSTFTAFSNPSFGGSSTATYYPHSAGAEQQGNNFGAVCSTTGDPAVETCSFTIDLLPNQTNFLLISSIGNKSNVTVEGYSSSNQLLEFSEGQIEVDTTARANDIIKRIKVAVPKASYNRPPYSAEVIEGICKDLEVWPTGTNTVSNICYNN